MCMLGRASDIVSSKIDFGGKWLLCLGVFYKFKLSINLNFLEVNTTDRISFSDSQ